MSVMDMLTGRQPVSGPFRDYLLSQGYKQGDQIDPQTANDLRARWLSDQNQQQQGQQLLQANRGFLASPDVGVAGAGNLASLLGSANPEARAQGQSLIGQYQAQKTPLTAYQAAGLAQDEAQFQQTLAMDKARTTAYVDNMTFDNALKASAAAREALKYGTATTQDLRKEFNADPVVIKTQQALTALDQGDRALNLHNAQALQAAIVAAVQIQEPGLAVRNDDRISYTGNSSAAEQLVALYNKFRSGGSVPPDVEDRMRALMVQLAVPHAKAYKRVLVDFEDIAAGTPGANPRQVTLGSGIDPAMLQTLLGQ